MASVDRDTFNGLAKVTDVNAGGHSELAPFDGVFVFGMDAFPAFAMTSRSAMKNQTIDGGYGRAFNSGRGIVGEGGDTGPGVVGRGTSSVGFSYRVVAKRKHVATKRFQKIKPPKRPKIPAPLVRPAVDIESLAAVRPRSKR
jgi:hypothetical protein